MRTLLVRLGYFLELPYRAERTEAPAGEFRSRHGRCLQAKASAGEDCLSRQGPRSAERSFPPSDHVVIGSHAEMCYRSGLYSS